MVWREVRQEASRAPRRRPGHRASDLSHGVRAFSAEFDSPVEFALCYAYDVFHRGWPYAEAVSSNGATYVPHPVRNRALVCQEMGAVGKRQRVCITRLGCGAGDTTCPA